MSRLRGRAGAGEILFHGGTLLDAPRAGRLRRPQGQKGGGEALLVRGNRIAAVGPLSELRREVGRGADRVDLRGGTLTPGFTDAHIHLITWVRALREPSLRAQDVASIEGALRERVASAPDQEWISIRGWVPREWGPGIRVRATLDRIAPTRPLVLHAVDGHSVWANAVALERAGIGQRTANPPGGLVERDAAGALTGALIEEAAKLLRPLIPNVATPAEDLARAIARAHSLGITGAHDFDRTLTWRPAQDLARNERLPFRLVLTIPEGSLESAEALGLETGFGDERLRVGPVKFFADGTLGSATALLEEPYEGRTDRGMEVIASEDLAARCTRAAAAGLSVAIHAIGDRAVRNALDAIEAAGRAAPAFRVPPRIEHAQLARAEDFPRFRALGVTASVQPIHQVSDRALARRLWGAGRTPRAYAYKRLLRAGARLCFGSDAPFDRAGPLLALQAALLRREGDEEPGLAFHPEERLTLSQALRAHLEEPHRAAGGTLRIGRLVPGFVADLVHFDQDLPETGAESWHRARVLGTWFDGNRVFGRRGSRER